MVQDVVDEIEVIGSSPLPVVSVNWWAILAAVLTAILFDVCVYRGYGMTGWGAFFAGATLLYLLGTYRANSHQSAWLIAVMLVLLAVRMMWFGTTVMIVCGICLLPTLAMCCRGLVPYFADWWGFILQSMLVGGVAVYRALTQSRPARVALSRSRLLGVLFPALALGIFGTIFVFANPDLKETFADWSEHMIRWVNHLFRSWDFSIEEFILIGLIAWLVLGQLAPLMSESIQGLFGSGESSTTKPVVVVKSELYAALRNMLIAVIALFAVYLVFEFRTLWFREFPKGFYYAGYAHKGAAWLTLALGVSTLLLSAIFHGDVLNDPRLPALKKLTWMWSAANLLLALAVYNRLLIYINFNGMTRMRVVGLFGITTVVIGFLLVIWKIKHGRRFVWLIQRDLWTLALAVYLLVLTPVDYLIHQYNAQKILAGQLAPSVQITEHPVDPSGWLALVPLVHCEDEIIREGIRAQLAGFHFAGVPFNRRSESNNPNHWTTHQQAREQLKQQLALHEDILKPYEQLSKRKVAWDEYKTYAYQWY